MRWQVKLQEKWGTDIRQDRQNDLNLINQWSPTQKLINIQKNDQEFLD